MMQEFVVFHRDQEGNTETHLLTRDELEEMLKVNKDDQTYFGPPKDVRFIDVKKFNNGERGLVIFKGHVIKPKPIEIVYGYDLGD